MRDKKQTRRQNIEINDQRVETLARQNGYRNGKALMKKLGAGKCAYGCLKLGCKIGYDLVKEIHNEFGALVMLHVIDLEGETLLSFQKQVHIGRGHALPDDGKRNIP